MTGPAALTPAEFAAAMTRLGPFEPGPRIAVAVSGGADSMALALLAHGWAAAQGGDATALTVDHGLRPDSAAEAARVGAWLAGRGIPHAVLAWSGEKPAAGIQAAARDARYRLLGDWCGARGVLHLLLAHHLEDQAETLLLRLGRGSGVDGLSAMAPVAETARVRVLRPLLDLPRERLRATLRAAGQDWVEDPSNDSAAFARVRMRRLQPVLAAEGLAPRRLADTAARMRRARAALDSAAADALAENVVLHPELWAEVDARLLLRPDEIALRVLARLLATVAGAAYTPRLDRVERLLAALRAGGRGRTLAGCRVLPGQGRFRVFREAAALPAPVGVESGAALLWDGRFRVTLSGPPGAAAILAGLPVEALPHGLRPRLPRQALSGLPALRDAGGILAVPHLGYNREGAGPGLRIESVVAAPIRPLTGV